MRDRRRPMPERSASSISSGSTSFAMLRTSMKDAAADAAAARALSWDGMVNSRSSLDLGLFCYGLVLLFGLGMEQGVVCKD
ncbi:unnamed protein product [Urochloa humidicola]